MTILAEIGPIEFEIPFTVQPKQADRSTKSGIHYQPKEVTENANNLAALVAPYRPAKPLDGPIIATFTFKFPWIGKHKKIRQTHTWWPKDTIPDLDNLEKQLCDVFQRSGFFKNDSRIFRKVTEKRYEDQGGINVRLEVWSETND